MLEQLQTNAALCDIHAESAREVGNDQEAKAWHNAALLLAEAMREIRKTSSLRKEDETARYGTLNVDASPKRDE